MPPAAENAAPSTASAVSSDATWQDAWPRLRWDSKRLMILLAEHPDEWVPMSAFLDALDSFGAVQGALSSLTKRLKKFANSRDWPFEVEDVDPQTGRARYRMDDATATVVLELAKGDA
jgi:hypothetical protein